MKQWKLYGWDPSLPRYREFYYDSFERVQEQTNNWGYDYFYKENYHFDPSATGSIYEMFNCSVRPGDVVLDLGANVGFFSRRAAQIGATVIAVEGSKECFSCLVENTYDLPNVFPLYGIVIGSEVTSTVWTSNQSQTPTITLPEIMDMFNLTKIDFLKCDIEGGEYDLIAHTPQNVWDAIESVALEAHGEQVWDISIPNKIRDHHVHNGSPSFYFRKMP
jgi:FkbM family methyltransferase